MTEIALVVVCSTLCMQFVMSAFEHDKYYIAMIAISILFSLF